MRAETKGPENFNVFRCIDKERATGLEPAMSSLGSWHSTAELRPQGLRRLALETSRQIALPCQSAWSTGERVRERAARRPSYSLTRSQSSAVSPQPLPRKS